MLPDGLPEDINELRRDVSMVNQKAVYKFSKEKGVPIGPKGGNGYMKGASQPTAGDKEGESVMTVDPTTSLRNFLQLEYRVKMHSIFWLFVPLHWFFPDDNVPTTLSMCLGQWFFDHYMVQSDSEST